MQPTVTIEIPASSEAVVRQLPAYHEELQSPALSAPHGTVIEACEDTLTDPARCGCGGTDRLPTTLSDGSTGPATSLELPDHERREEEPAIDELKTHRRERPVLRSRTAAGAADRYVGD